MTDPQRITPRHISKLNSNEVFVFGSNANGMHGGGAARAAVTHFGAVWGQGHGMQGQSYAINSMSGIEPLKRDIADFEAFARQHPELRFFVTRIGCGIAGYKASDMAPLFRGCMEMTNVTLPDDFWDILEK